MDGHDRKPSELIDRRQTIRSDPRKSKKNHFLVRIRGYMSSRGFSFSDGSSCFEFEMGFLALKGHLVNRPGQSAAPPWATGDRRESSLFHPPAWARPRRADGKSLEIVSASRKTPGAAALDPGLLTSALSGQRQGLVNAPHFTPAGQISRFHQKYWSHPAVMQAKTARRSVRVPSRTATASHESQKIRYVEIQTSALYFERTCAATAIRRSIVEPVPTWLTIS